MENALQQIMARAPSVAQEAALALKAPKALRQRLYNELLVQALRDPEAQWTLAEGEALIKHYREPDDVHSVWLPPIRVTPKEHAEIEQCAEAEGVSLSEYLHQRVLS